MSNKRLDRLATFDLKKYAELRTFAPEQWAPLIESRLHLRTVINGLNKEMPANDGSPSSFRMYAGLLIEHLLSRPLVPFGKFARRQFVGENTKASTVSPLQAIDVMHLQRAVLEVHERFPNALSLPDRDLSVAQWEGGNFDSAIDDVIRKSKHYNIRHLANFAVDLRADDATIRRDFNKLLASSRKRFKLDLPAITDARLKLWHSNNVLPYADLTLWAKLTSTKLVETDFIELLFDVNDVRKYGDDPLFGTIRDFKEAITHAILPTLRQGIPKKKEKLIKMDVKK